MARSGKATLTVAIGGEYTGRSAIRKAEADLRALREEARQTGGISSGIMSIGDSFVDLGSNMEVAGQKMSGFGANLTKATAPLTALGTASMKLASDYEASIAKVYTIMDKQAMSTERMSQDILDLSTSTGKAATELADASYQALSASVDTSKVASFVEQAVKLSKSGFTETATAVDTLTTVINAYGYTADDAAMISERLVQTQNKGKTTVDELASSMGAVIPTASAYNVSLDNLMSSYVVLTKQGINTASATTALNGMMTELADSGSEVSKVLQKGTGKTFGQLMADGETLGGVIQMLSDSVGGNSEAFANLWSSVEASKGALAIANSGAYEFESAMRDMADSAGLVDAALEDLTTPASKANKAINALKNTGIDLGEEMLGAAVPALDDLAGGVQGLYKWFSELDDGTKQTIVKVGALVAATGPAVTMFGKASTAMGGFVTSLGKGVQNVGAFTAAMKVTEAEMKAAGAASVSLGAKMKGAAQATGVATKATTMLKGSLATIGIGAAVVAVGAIVDAYAQWKEHTDQVEKATNGLETAMDAAGSSAASYADALTAATGALEAQKNTAEDALRSQAELADKASEAFSDVGTNAALVERYSKTMVELAGKGKLTAEEQVRLSEAVKQYNAITGESIEIIDEETGRLDENKRAILETAEAYRQRAKAAAAQELLVEIEKQIYKDEQALAQAREEADAAARAYGETTGMNIEMQQLAADTAFEASRKVEELEASLESARKTEQAYIDAVAAGGPIVEDQADKVDDLGASMDGYAESAFEASDAAEAFSKELDAQYKAQEKALDASYKSQQKAFQAEEKALQKAHQSELKNLQKSLDAQYDALEDKLDARYDALEDALDKEEQAYKDSHAKRLEAMKESQEAEVRAFEKATDRKLAAMEKEYKASVSMAEAASDARTKAIDEQIAALDAEDEAAEKASVESERDQKKAELQKAVNTAKSTTARARAEKELSDYLDQIAAEDAKARRQEQREKLIEAKQGIADELAAEKDSIAARYTARTEAYKQQRSDEQAAMEEANAAEYEIQEARYAASEAAMAESHARRLGALKSANEAQLEALGEAQDAQLEALRESQQAQEEALSESNQERLESMREAQQAQLEALKESQAAQLEAMKSSEAQVDTVWQEIASDADQGSRKASSNVKQELDRSSPEVQEKVEGIRQGVLRVFGKSEEDAEKSGGEVGGNFADGVSSKEQIASSSAGKLGSAATKGLENSTGGTGTVGGDFAIGFLNGMTGIDVFQVAYNIGLSALDAIKQALGIASPSKEAIWVGEMYGKGIALGMGAMEGEIASESRRLTDAMTLEPTPYGTYALPGAYRQQYAAQRQQAARQIAFNLTVNVSARSEQEAATLGKSFGEAMYDELARRERQLSNAI